MWTDERSCFAHARGALSEKKKRGAVPVRGAVLTSLCSVWTLHRPRPGSTCCRCGARPTPGTRRWYSGMLGVSGVAIQRTGGGPRARGIGRLGGGSPSLAFAGRARDAAQRRRRGARDRACARGARRAATWIARSIRRRDARRGRRAIRSTRGSAIASADPRAAPERNAVARSARTVADRAHTRASVRSCRASSAREARHARRRSRSVARRASVSTMLSSIGAIRSSSDMYTYART